MGADIVGWISCPLQRKLGGEDFFWKIKLLSAKQAIEKSFPEAARADVQVKLFGTNRRWHQLTFEGIQKELGDFAAGIPECADCPISSGKTLGCHKFINYPIDEQFERLVFDYFVSQVAIKDSICNQIYVDIVSQFPSSGTPWHTQRGSAEAGGLALLEQPLRYEWGAPFSKRSIDSAQVLGSLFISLEHPAMVVGYTKFWMHLIDYAEERGVKHTPTLDEIVDALNVYVPMVPFAIHGNGVILVES